jgi:hypothetical protein
MVDVTLNGNYAFAVMDGGRTISPSATTHKLKQPNGKALQVSAPDHFLSQSVKVEGSAGQPFEFVAPGLGSLDVRSTQETCDVVIQGKKLGNPPLTIKDIAAGSYKVDLSCGGEVVKSAFATVQSNRNSVAVIR